MAMNEEQGGFQELSGFSRHGQDWSSEDEWEAQNNRTKAERLKRAYVLNLITKLHAGFSVGSLGYGYHEKGGLYLTGSETSLKHFRALVSQFTNGLYEAQVDFRTGGYFYLSGSPLSAQPTPLLPMSPLRALCVSHGTLGLMKTRPLHSLSLSSACSQGYTNEKKNVEDRGISSP